MIVQSFPDIKSEHISERKPLSSSLQIKSTKVILSPIIRAQSDGSVGIKRINSVLC